MIAGPSMLLTPITFTHQSHLDLDDYEYYYFELAGISTTDPEPEVRKIVSVEGYPFYCSTGTNSGHVNTWFPFTGMMEGYRRGWFIKPSETSEISQEVKDVFNKCFPNDEKEAKNLADRFATLPALLISAELGGGFWETTIGLKLKQDLKIKYQEFQPKFQLMNVEKDFNDNHIEGVNEWLCAAAKVNYYGQLKIPQKMSDFTFYHPTPTTEKGSAGFHVAYKTDQNKRAYLTRELGTKFYFSLGIVITFKHSSNYVTGILA